MLIYFDVFLDHIMYLAPDFTISLYLYLIVYMCTLCICMNLSVCHRLCVVVRGKCTGVAPSSYHMGPEYEAQVVRVGGTMCLYLTLHFAHPYFLSWHYIWRLYGASHCPGFIIQWTPF